MSGKKRIVREENTTHFNHETGEIKQESHTTTTVHDTEPPYVKMYLKDLSNILEIPHGPRALLMQLVESLDYEGYITLNPARKKIIKIKMAKALGKEKEISDGTFRNYLSKLVKSEILRPSEMGRGLYEMNPRYFARGTWKEISERRRNFGVNLNIRYSSDGNREIDATLVEEPPKLKSVESA